MRIHQKLRSSGLKSGFLAGVLCLVAVCASAQNGPQFTGLSLPLTFGQKFILTNKMLFAPSEYQLQNMEIVFAYEPLKFSNIIKNIKIKNSEFQSFKIVNPHVGASKDSKGTWKVWRVSHNQITDALIKEIEKKKGFIAISKDDHKRFLHNVTDKEASDFIKDAKQFFIFQSSRQTQNTRGS